MFSTSAVLSEKEIFVDRKYSDAREHLKSLYQIAFEAPEAQFYHQKSTLCIFRFEDVIFSLYPHMAQIRKRGMPSIKEIFIKSDPTAKDAKESIQSNQNLQNNAYMSMQSGGDVKNELSSQKSGGGLGNLASLRKKTMFVN